MPAPLSNTIAIRTVAAPAARPVASAVRPAATAERSRVDATRVEISADARALAFAARPPASLPEGLPEGGSGTARNELRSAEGDEGRRSVEEETRLQEERAQERREDSPALEQPELLRFVYDAFRLEPPDQNQERAQEQRAQAGGLDRSLRDAMNLLRAFTTRNEELGAQRIERFDEVRERIARFAPEPDRSGIELPEIRQVA